MFNNKDTLSSQSTTYIIFKIINIILFKLKNPFNLFAWKVILQLFDPIGITKNLEFALYEVKTVRLAGV